MEVNFLAFYFNKYEIQFTQLPTISILLYSLLHHLISIDRFKFEMLNHFAHLSSVLYQRPDNVFLVSVQGISNTRVISDFHSKSPDLVIIIIDLSEVTVPDE